MLCLDRLLLSFFLMTCSFELSATSSFKEEEEALPTTPPVRPLITHVRVLRLPKELNQAHLRLSLPGPNIITCDAEGGTFALNVSINPYDIRSKIWSQYPYEDKETYGYIEIQEGFGVRGVLEHEDLQKGSLPKKTVTLIGGGPLLHGRDTRVESLKHSPYRGSVTYEQLSYETTICISIEKNSSFNRYILLSSLG